MQQDSQEPSTMTFSQRKRFHNEQQQKFSAFLKNAQLEQAQHTSNVSIQRKISSIMNEIQYPYPEGKQDPKQKGVYSGVNIQANVLSELKQRMNRMNETHQEIANKKDIEDKVFLKANLPRILKVQAVFRGRKERKMIEKIRKNYRHRANVIKELIQTELTYVQDLLITRDYILSPLIDSKILTENYAKIFASNLDELLEHHKQMMIRLQQPKLTDPQYLFAIGLVLLEFSSKFSVYFEYCESYSKQDRLYTDLLESNPAFREYDQSLGTKATFRGLGWSGFFVKPIQRLPKYILLLSDFLKHTEPDHRLRATYQQAYNQFKEVCDENNSRIDSISNSLKLFELQKDYGDANGLQILDHKRKFIFEEMISLISDNLEVHYLVYGLTDMLLICEPALENEHGYKLYRNVNLNERSYVQSLPNKRYLTNMTKLIGKNRTITFVSPTPEEKRVLIQQLTNLIQDLKQKMNKVKANQFNFQIEVQVVGTEQRDRTVHMLSPYTVYVIEVTIDRITTKLYLRYSELKDIYLLIQKECPDVQLPQFRQTNWFNKHESKVIEGRKLEIEDFLIALLVSEEFQQKDKRYQSKIFDLLGLEENFYLQPSILKAMERRSQSIMSLPTFLDNGTPSHQKISDQQSRLSRLHQTTEDKFTAVQLRESILSISKMGSVELDIPGAEYYLSDDMKTGSRRSRQLTTFHNETMDTIVYLYDERRLEMKVPKWHRAIDLVRLIAREIHLAEYCDFRLFESDLEQEIIKPIMEDEIIFHVLQREQRSQFHKLMNYLNPKCLIFRKYIFFPRFHEETQNIIQRNQTRQDLVVGQLFIEISKMKFSFKTEDYVLFISLYMIMKQCTLKDYKQVMKGAIKRLIPKAIFKQKKKKDWIDSIQKLFARLSKNVSQLSHMNSNLAKKYNYDDEDEFDETRMEPQDIVEVKELKHIVAGCLLINYVNKHLFYGLEVFSVEMKSNDMKKVSEYVLRRVNKKVLKDGFALAVSNKGFHFVDNQRQLIYITFQFTDFDEIISHSDQLTIWLEDRNLSITFQTNDGYFILSLLQDYQYLEVELQKFTTQS